MKWLTNWRRKDGASPLPPVNLADDELNELNARYAKGVSPELLNELEGALGRRPDSGSLHHLHAQTLRRLGHPALARDACERALAQDCDAYAVQVTLAECHRDLHDMTAAFDAVNVAIALNEQGGEAWLLLSELLLRQERPADGIAVAKKAIEHLQQPPSLGVAWFRLGHCLLECQRPGEAVRAFEQSLAHAPDAPGTLVALGHAKLLDEDEIGAIEVYERGLTMVERPTQTHLLNLGISYMNVGRYAQARTLLERLHLQYPGNHGARWYICQLDLLQCRWKEGWANHGARFSAGCSPYRPMPYRPWLGQALNQDETLLVLADQGLGDEIMYASCLPDVMRRVRSCIVECEPRLLSLFKRSFPDLHFVATQRENTTAWLAGLPEPQYQVVSGDLPALFRNSDDEFPRHQGYLRASPDRVVYWAERLTRMAGHRLKVGISWRGGIANTRTKARTLQPDHWAPILAVPGVQFVNLQYGQYRQELDEIEQRNGIEILDYPEAISDYDETAALVSALDLVITVCTAVVHLSGALGKPVWVLTPHAPGFRYTADRSSLPWYPSSRIFRQSSHGEWQSACQEVSLALQSLDRNCHS